MGCENKGLYPARFYFKQVWDKYGLNYALTPSSALILAKSEEAAHAQKPAVNRGER